MNSEVKSAARVLELLEFLARATHTVTLTDVVNELGYPKSSAHGLLSTLVLRGYASRDEANRYMLNNAYRNGPGWLSGPDAVIIDVAERWMSELRDVCDETVMLGVLNKDLRLKSIAKSVAKRRERYDTPFSGGMPSYCAAMGRVLLASLDDRQVARYLSRERLVKLTRHTVVDKVALRRMIAEAGEAGYAISMDQMEMGATGVAAPVRNSSGKVIAALDIAVISSRFPERETELVDLVMTYASHISGDMA